MMNIVRVIVAWLMSLICLNAMALSVSPIKLELGQGQKAIQINVGNDTDEQRTYDVRVFKWVSVNQQTGHSVTSDLADSPILLSKPVLILEPGQTATIRLSVAKRNIENDSDFYRIVIDDITPKLKTVESTANISMSVSLPLQVHNSAPKKGNLTPLGDGKLTNSGQNILTVLGSRMADGKIDGSFSRYMFPGEVWDTNLDPSNLVWLPGIQ
jgi:P pilus assembly chaperone PapD